MKTRRALPSDADAMSAVLTALCEAGLRDNHSDVNFVISRYIENEDLIQTTVALGVLENQPAQEQVIGFQSLLKVGEGNFYQVTPGWGVIGTHVHPQAIRQGAGRALFEATRSAARQAGLAHIDATIGANNPLGLGYYSAMGFIDYRTLNNGAAISKRYDVETHRD